MDLQNAVDAPEFPREGCSGSGSEVGYSIEFRVLGNAPPVIVAGKIIDAVWRLFKPEAASHGVPACHPYYRHTVDRGLMSYPAAQAIRWWVHAVADAEQIGGGLRLESRIVKHLIKYTHAEEVVSAHALVGGDDRSSLIPDWGKK
jgi:hypothetical protein